MADGEIRLLLCFEDEKPLAAIDLSALIFD
jgi:hypothetical protein